MNNWSEPDIALIYFSGLIIALVTAIVLLWVFRGVRSRIRKITIRSSGALLRIFTTSIVFASLLGAMSVSFRDCKGSYDALLDSKKETVIKGLEQVSSSFRYIHWILLLWLVLFIILLILTDRKGEKQSGNN